jgi:hypothetical protein
MCARTGFFHSHIFSSFFCNSRSDTCMHEGLNGKTPAEACGITIEGKNKWKTLIQNARLSDSQR